MSPEKENDLKAAVVKQGKLLSLNTLFTLVGPVAVLIGFGMALGAFKANDVHQNIEIASIKSQIAADNTKRDRIISLLDTLNVAFHEQAVWAQQQVVVRDAALLEIRRRIDDNEKRIAAETQRINEINNRWRYTP